jgi:hypothetical protein
MKREVTPLEAYSAASEAVDTVCVNLGISSRSLHDVAVDVIAAVATTHGIAHATDPARVAGIVEELAAQTIEANARNMSAAFAHVRELANANQKHD